MIPLKAEVAIISEVEATLTDWESHNKVSRLWARDATLWTGTDEAGWLGWLDVTGDLLAGDQHLRDISSEMVEGVFSHALLLGMGGSSLCPEVLKMTFGCFDGYPELIVLDSTDPAQVRSFERTVELGRTLFIVSSKSGTTLEPNVLTQYFFDRVGQTIGREKAGRHFIAITDPGSRLQQIAERDGFRHVFHGVPGIGGRYSALSNFGMVPAAIMGLDPIGFLRRAHGMVKSCSPSRPVHENPGVVLGAVLGVLHRHGRDKVTFVVSPGVSSLGAWLEQLVAESTGKEGRALIPVDRENLGRPEVYGRDRVFVYVRLESAPDATQDAAIDVIEQAGLPVVRLALPETNALGAEFFRWEIATAVAGSLMGINPFNQPDVEASKVETRRLTSQVEEVGELPPEAPILEDSGIRLFADPRTAAVLAQAAGDERSLVGFLRAHVKGLTNDDYFALLAYVEMNEPHEEMLQVIRHRVRDRKKVATCLGFGPRFLHSTGQAYKGGPNTGVFLQVTCDDACDIPIPGYSASFGVVKAAQARGDFDVLAERRRRALRVHLGADVEAGLTILAEATEQALAG